MCKTRITDLDPLTMPLTNGCCNDDVIPEQIDFHLTILVYCCMNGTAPRYLGSELQRVADIESRRRLRSASSPSLHVPRSLHRTIGNRAFPVAAAKAWNALPPAITSLPSLGAFSVP